jgi:hypothetical protein
MIWNEEYQILLIIGKENQRIFIKIDQMKLFNISNKHENDYMNAEHALLIKFNENILLLIESKMNYCLIYSINIDENQVISYKNKAPNGSNAALIVTSVFYSAGGLLR